MTETEIAVLKVKMDSIQATMVELKQGLDAVKLDVNKVTANWSRIIFIALIVAQFVSTGKIDKSLTDAVTSASNLVLKQETLNPKNIVECEIQQHIKDDWSRLK